MNLNPYFDNIANVPVANRYVIAVRPPNIYQKSHFIVPLVGLAITLVLGIGVAALDQKGAENLRTR
jgi:hypothetical protein